MLKKIVLKNFMSHKSSVLELVDGVNVITGPNNSGKSAIISALQILTDLPSKEGDYMVRHGTNETEIAVTTAEDHEISWKRTGSTISLTIDGEKFNRLQNNREHYLAKIHTILRLPKVAARETQDDFDIHFGTQKQPLFLIHEPPSRAAVFFASSSDAGRLTEIREKYKGLVGSKKKEREKAMISLSKQETILAKLAPLDELDSKVQFVKSIYHSFSKSLLEYKNLSDVLVEAKKIANEHRQPLVNKSKALVSLNPPPTFEETANLERFINEYQSLHCQKKKCVEKLQALENLSAENMPSANERDKMIACKQSIDLIKDAATQRTYYQSKVLCIQNLQSYPILNDVKPLQTVALEYSQLIERKERLSDNLTEANKALELFIDENPLCPLCGNSFSGAMCYA